MPIFVKDDKFILYVHVPKTGGSYIELLFQNNGFALAYYDRGVRKPTLNTVRHCSPQHMHATMIEAIFDPDAFDHAFMTVRHPIERLMSEYRMRLSRENPVDINDWIGHMIDGYEEDAFLLDNHIRPQSEFFMPGIRTFKQEDGFDDAWAREIETEFSINLEQPVSQQAKSSESKKSVAQGTSEISPENRGRILRLYERDFELFDYKPDFGG